MSEQMRQEGLEYLRNMGPAGVAPQAPEVEVNAEAAEVGPRLTNRAEYALGPNDIVTTGSGLVMTRAEVDAERAAGRDVR